jgi:hypothetical protein
MSVILPRIIPDPSWISQPPRMKMKSRTFLYRRCRKHFSSRSPANHQEFFNRHRFISYPVPCPLGLFETVRIDSRHWRRGSARVSMARVNNLRRGEMPTSEWQ